MRSSLASQVEAGTEMSQITAGALAVAGRAGGSVSAAPQATGTGVAAAAAMVATGAAGMAAGMSGAGERQM